MNYKYVIVATDMVAGMPDGQDGGKGSQAGGKSGPWKDGFQPLKGDWEPEGMRVIEFDAEQEARDWYNGHEGQVFAKKYDSIILVRVVA